jgi:hypothetical protein
MTCDYYERFKDMPCGGLHFKVSGGSITHDVCSTHMWLLGDVGKMHDWVRRIQDKERAEARLTLCGYFFIGILAAIILAATIQYIIFLLFCLFIVLVVVCP